MSSSQYTEADFERAMRFIAWLIELYGDAYWPVFDWLEEELEVRRTRTAKLQQYGKSRECGIRQNGISPALHSANLRSDSESSDNHMKQH